MGKGDIKTKRGKIAKGTYGVSRLHKEPQPEKATEAGDSKKGQSKKGKK